MKSRVNNFKIPIGVLLSTVFIAFFCDVKAITSFLVADSGYSQESETGPMTYLYLFSLLGALFISLSYSQWKNRKFSTSVLFIIYWVSLFYILTYFFIAPPFTNLILFGLYTITSLFLPSITKIDGRLFLKASMFFVFPAIFRLESIFILYDYSDTITMGKSYAFLFPCIASVVYYFVYFKNESFYEKVITIILFAINGVFAFYLISYGSRGPVLSILAVVAFCVVFRQSKDSVGIKTQKGRFSLLISTTIFVIFAFLSIIQQLQDVLGSYGQSVNFVDKILRLNESGDVSNGRQVLYSMAFSDIVTHPFFGMGMDQFNNNHGNFAAYPHNFIIQILYDGGILLLLILAVPIINGFKKVWKTCTLDEYAIVVALAFSAMPRAMYSGDFWQNGPLWMLFGIVLCNKFVINTNRKK